MICRRSVVSLLLVFALLFGSPVLGSPVSAESERTYLALGDSIAAGIATSLPERRGYPSLLASLMEANLQDADQASGIQLVNLAVPGETVGSFLEDGQLDETRESIERIRQDNRQLDTVTLTIGGNDILALQDLDESDREARFRDFQEDFDQLVSELGRALLGTGANVIVTTYYDLTGGDAGIDGSDTWWLNRFNEHITRSSEAARFTVVDLETVFEDRIHELTWYPADIHPNNAGHRAISTAIWKELDYDTSAPSIQITRPVPGSTITLMPTVIAEVADNVGVQQVELYAGNELQSTLIYVPVLEAWATLFDGRVHVGESIELTVVASDLAGNIASESVIVELPNR